MVLRTTNARFDVAWDENLSAIAISTGVKYTIVGGELNSDHSAALNVDQNTAPVYVDGEEKEVHRQAAACLLFFIAVNSNLKI